MLNQNKNKKKVKVKEIIDTWQETVTPKKKTGNYTKAAKKLGISVNTVKKYVTHYQELQKKIRENPDDENARNELHDYINGGKERKKREYKQPKRTDSLASFINDCLDINEYNESQTGWKKQNLSGLQMFERAEDLGFKVGYSTFMRFKKEIEDERQKESPEEEQGQSHPRVHTEQNYAPGEVVEFDWGEIHINIQGKNVRVYVAVFAMPYSNYRIAYVYTDQDTESFIDAHNRFFAHIGAMPYTMVYDNMRIVRKYFGNKRVKELTDVAKQMKTFFGYNIRLCNAHAGNEKSHVERAVAWTRNIGFKWRIDYDSLEDAEECLLKKTREYYESSRRITDEDREKFQEDIAALKQPFTRKFEITKFYNRKVDKLSCVVLENVKYSVPEELSGQVVRLQVIGSDLRIFHEGKLAAQYVITGEDCLDIRHLGNYFKKNPNAIEGSDFYLGCPEAQRVCKHVFNGDFTILGAFLAANRHTEFSQFEIRAKEFMRRWKERTENENQKTTQEQGGEEQSQETSEEFKKRMEEYNDLFIK